MSQQDADLFKLLGLVIAIWGVPTIIILMMGWARVWWKRDRSCFSQETMDLSLYKDLIIRGKEEQLKRKGIDFESQAYLDEMDRFYRDELPVLMLAFQKGERVDDVRS